MLDKNGFHRKTYQDLLEDMQNRARRLFGENINVSVRSPLGVIIMLFAWFLSLAWELAEKVYNSGFVSRSEGVQLDRLSTIQGLSREPAAESYVTLVFTGRAGFTIPEQTQFSTENDVYFYLIENVTLDSQGNGSGNAVSVEKGLYTNVGANTVTILAEPLEEIISVNNPEAATGGRSLETDAEFRARIISSAAGGGKATISAISSALTQTSGVRASNIVINNKMEADAEGNPPKSVHAYVLGGTEEAIATSLFNSVAAGIETVGQEVVMVEDLSGVSHGVRFDYAVEKQIQIQLTLQTDATFPVDGEVLIKDNLIQSIGGVDSSGTTWIGNKMGQDIIYSKLFSQIYKVTGIEDATLLIEVKGETLGTSNVTIGPQEVAQTDVASVEVILA
ncbi:baseplate J/gp47 family protein [Priestia filamentosa]|uniref:baseplate J/gp47 family protein n=1 Tax=Priestia filamentosa TaxID=1402861 RepID=UPI0039838A1A